jgi:hypothetical protein
LISGILKNRIRLINPSSAKYLHNNYIIGRIIYKHFNHISRIYVLTLKAEPMIPESITSDDIKKVILERLLANETDIKNFITKLNEMADLTEWCFVGSEYISIFEEEGLDKASDLIKRIMHSFLESQPTEKSNLFNPIEELF